MEALHEQNKGRWLSTECCTERATSLVLCETLFATPGIRNTHSSIELIKIKSKHLHSAYSMLATV